MKDMKPKYTGAHLKGDTAEYRKKLEAERIVVKPEQTNASFAAENEQFRNACAAAGIEPTAKQASKFRNKTGLAYDTMVSLKNTKD